ncbi:MAG: hypothetical protein HGB35_06655 [Geobacteraceae bacterium]|nr:hypothetical protein [Geobacteraceae bacterium]
MNFEEFQSGEAERGVHFGSQLSYNPSTEQESVPAAIAASPVSTQPWNPPQPKAASPVSSRPAAKAKASVNNLEKLLFALVGLLILCILCGLGYPLIRAPLTGLTASRATPTPVNYAAVLYENIRASNSEDIQAYMTTIHPRSPAYATTQEMLKKLNATYDLSYKVSGVTVMQENNREVRLSFVLVTRKIRGPSFRNNQINGVMILRKDGEVWKIYNQEINNIQYLN